MNHIEILMDLMKHLDYLECLKRNTLQILKCNNIQNMDELTSLTDNRERLLSLIKQFQSKVLIKLKGLNQKNEMKEELKDILRTWGEDTNSLLNETKVLERNATETLNMKKEELRRDILDLQKEKKLVQKYGLSSVK